MVATLSADIDRATWDGDTTALFAFSADRDLLPLATLLRQAEPDLFQDNPRVAHAPARPSRWPDLLADAIDRLATRSLQGIGRHVGLGGSHGYAEALADTARRLGVPVLRDPPGIVLEQSILARFGLGEEVAATVAVPAGAAALGELAAVVFRVAALRARTRARLGFAPFRLGGVEEPAVGVPESAADEGRVEQVRSRFRGLRFGSWDELIDRLAGPGERLAFARMPPCNILVCGKSGAGKSTLVNAVFGRDLAATGVGRPVTERASWYDVQGFPIRLLDTRGLQPGDYAGSRAALEAAIRAARAEAAPDRQLHLAWLCIDNGSGRVEEADVALARMLAEQSVPVVCVLTKGWEDRGMEARANEALPAPLARAVVRVVAAAKTFRGGATRPSEGLARLVDESEALLPDGHRGAFAAAQSVAIEPKVRAARRVIDGATASAAAMAATPIPFADWLTLTPTMIGMVAGISRAVGVEMREDKAAGLALSVVGALATTFTARAAASFAASLLKMIPGIGTLAGGAINAAVAGGLTKALGEAYLDYLVGHIRKYGQWPTLDEIAAFLKDRWMPFRR